MATALVAVIEEDLDESTPEKQHGSAKRGQLGLSIILLAISDFRNADPDSPEFVSAKNLLFPADPEEPDTKQHWQWICDVGRGLDAAAMRWKLDGMRRAWGADRETGQRFRRRKA